jgi:hypothetical protein
MLALLYGCATPQPQAVFLEPNVSLTQYHSIAVAPIVIDSDAPVSPLLGAELRLDLEEDLAQKGYEIVNYKDGPANTLMLRCEYVTFAPGSFGKNLAAVAASAIIPFPGSATFDGAEATVEISLSDKGSAKALGDLTITKKSPPGAYAMQKEVANAAADAIDARIKGP